MSYINCLGWISFASLSKEHPKARKAAVFHVVGKHMLHSALPRSNTSKCVNKKNNQLGVQFGVHSV